VGGTLAGVAAFIAFVAIPLYFIYNVFILSPEEREAAGNRDFLEQLVYTYTPSPWRKSYLAGNEDEGDVEELDLPGWQPDLARKVSEPESVACLTALQTTKLKLDSLDAPMDVTYWTLTPPKGVKPLDAPPIILVHGFDSSVLEFRFVAPKLAEAGFTVHAVDWWTGGFTDRMPILRKLESSDAKPWELVREQLHAFWKMTCGSTPALVLGASLGGAPTMDFAVEHPESVAGLVLMDSGGLSYAQPPPLFTAALAGPVANFFAWRGEQDLLPYPHFWRQMPGWRDSLAAYLQSGGYQVRVNEELVRTVPQKALVLWGEEDDVLPVEDAAKFEALLPNCAGVRLIPDAMHAPALENPAFVTKSVAEFAKTF